MRGVAAVREQIVKNLDHIRTRFNVEDLYLFGSIVRGERNEDSDIDVLVTFNDDADLYDMSELQAFLEDLLGSEVDIVSKRAIRSEFKDQIDDEAIKV
jgi:predicted nucleotidyltransferase